MRREQRQLYSVAVGYWILTSGLQLFFHNIYLLYIIWLEIIWIALAFGSRARRYRSYFLIVATLLGVPILVTRGYLTGNPDFFFRAFFGLLMSIVTWIFLNDPKAFPNEVKTANEDPSESV